VTGRPASSLRSLRVSSGALDRPGCLEVHAEAGFVARIRPDRRSGRRLPRLASRVCTGRAVRFLLESPSIRGDDVQTAQVEILRSREAELAQSLQLEETRWADLVSRLEQLIKQ
jgi:hypothetical protein